MPLVYMCVRPQRGAADAEYESFRAMAGLAPDDLEMHDLVHDPLPPDAFERWSGFLVGGSPFNVTDPASSKTDVQVRLEGDLERVAAAAASGRASALFTCYGIGVVVRMLGGEVSRRFPEDTGPAMAALTPAGEADPLFGALASRFTMLTAHKEGSGSVPPGAVLLATNDACPVQAFRVGDRLYATQFHPEASTHAFVERMEIYRNGGYFDSSDFETLAQRVLAASVTEPGRIIGAFARELSRVAG